VNKERIGIFGGVVLVALVVAGIYFLAPHAQPESEHSAAPVSDIAPPSITPEMDMVIKSGAPFQYIVSYTDTGFEPRTITVKKGETIRFVNNSSQPLLWVASSGESGKVYPSDRSKCGQSEFDSCATIDPGAFWQFSFTKSGTWSYKNNANTKETGEVLVK
jgi:plastocyanin